MSRSTLRRIRRLKAKAEPVIAELSRRKGEWERSLPLLAEEHLLRVIAVFRYGEPRIDEPLTRAYERALSKLGLGEIAALIKLRGILLEEPPDGDIRSKLSAWEQQMPEWLRCLCMTNLSTVALKLEGIPISDELKLTPSKSDFEAWPLLPKEVLVPQRNYGELGRFMEAMSSKEKWSYYLIRQKPEEGRTRLERKFLREMHTRDPGA